MRPSTPSREILCAELIQNGALGLEVRCNHEQRPVRPAPILTPRRSRLQSTRGTGLPQGDSTKRKRSGAVEICLHFKRWLAMVKLYAEGHGTRDDQFHTIHGFLSAFLDEFE